MREGDRFDNYVLQERVAQGGMADIYRALRVGTLDISREVCIKCIRPALCTDGEFVRMFIDEARIASTLRHSNIVAVDHFGIAEGAPFMCTEWVHGTDLALLLTRIAERGRPIPVDAALHIVAEVLKALEYAHGKIDHGAWLQIVHRDVSPHNVMVSYSGDVKLTDFGIARATSRLHQTHGEMIKGKLAYMAPEQAVGDPLDHRADLFAVGVVAYELLTGRRPFKGDTEIDGVQRMLRGERPRITAQRDDVPPEVEHFLDVLLSNDPQERFLDAGVALDEMGDLPPYATGARTLQRLLRELYAEVPFSTMPPRLASTLVPPSPTVKAAVIAGTESTELAMPVARLAGVQAPPTLSELRSATRPQAPLRSAPSPLVTSEMTPQPRVLPVAARSVRPRVGAQTRRGRALPMVVGALLVVATVAVAVFARPEPAPASASRPVVAPAVTLEVSPRAPEVVADASVATAAPRPVERRIVRRPRPRATAK